MTHLGPISVSPVGRPSELASLCDFLMMFVMLGTETDSLANDDSTRLTKDGDHGGIRSGWRVLVND